MVSFIGFDSREFLRKTIKKDGSEGKFESVLGIGIKVDNILNFDESYSEAIEHALKKSKMPADYKYYCTHDIPTDKRDSFLEYFFEKIYGEINRAFVFYALFSEQQLSEINVYGRMSKRLKIKLARPTRTRTQLFSEHIVQCFPMICAWRITELFKPDTVTFLFDFYQGHICEAQEEIEKFNFSTYPNGDCSNPLISTADLLTALLDIRLKKNGKFLLFENIRPTIPELGERLQVYPILNQHLPKITPVDNIPIDTRSKMKHPVFWVFKNDETITNEFIKSSKAYRNVIDYASCQGGVVKLFDRKRDTNHIEKGDFGVYHNSSGKESVESFTKLGKPLEPFELDLMVPSE